MRSENTIFGLKFFFKPVSISRDSSNQEIAMKFQCAVLQSLLPRYLFFFPGPVTAALRHGVAAGFRSAAA